MSSGSTGGTIAKIFLAIGAGCVGLLRVCSRTGDDAARALSKTDDLRYVSRMDEGLYAGRMSGLDDVAMLTEEAATVRVRDFELSVLDDLEETSALRKAYESTAGLSPQMRLQMMQAELMPPSVRRAMSMPDGDKLYSLMMGRTITQQEATALRNLFSVPVSPTDAAFDSYVFLGRRIDKLPVKDDLHQMNARMVEALEESQGGMRDVSVNTQHSSTRLEDVLGSAEESKVLTEKTILVERKLHPDLALKLLKLGVKFIHRTHQLSHLLEHRSDEYEVWIHAPEDDEAFMEEYSVAPEEAERMRKDIRSLDKLKGFHIAPTLEAIRTANKKQEDRMLLVCGRPTQAYGLAIPMIQLEGYVPQVDSTGQREYMLCWQPAASALRNARMDKKLNASEWIAQIGIQYSVAVEKLSNGKITAQVEGPVMERSAGMGAVYFIE